MRDGSLAQVVSTGRQYLQPSKLSSSFAIREPTAMRFGLEVGIPATCLSVTFVYLLRATRGGSMLCSATGAPKTLWVLSLKRYNWSTWGYQGDWCLEM